MGSTRPPLPPFDLDGAVLKVRAAEDAWSTREPVRVARVCAAESVWRNRSEFLAGRGEIERFLERKWKQENECRLLEKHWAHAEDRRTGRFAYEWRDDEGQWFRSCGNENWEFDAAGLVRIRHARINDVAIDDGASPMRWPLGPRPSGRLGLSDLRLYPVEVVATDTYWVRGRARAFAVSLAMRLGLGAVIACASGTVSAGYATPEAAVAALWRALSHERGAGPDTAALDALFNEQGVVFGSRVRDGEAMLVRQGRDEFIDRLRTARNYSFSECETNRVVNVEGRFAVVQSRVESTRMGHGHRARFVGINSLQLYKADTGWTIVSLYYHVLPDTLAANQGNVEKCL